LSVINAAKMNDVMAFEIYGKETIDLNNNLMISKSSKT
jgi:hypothetical protein